MPSERYILKPRSYYQGRFDGGRELFSACWRQYRTYLNGAIDDPRDDRDVLHWLDEIASERVNDCKSRFFIRG